MNVGNFVLNKENSLKYYRSKKCRQIAHEKYDKISLNLSGHNNIIKTNHLKKVYNLNLSYCKNVTNVKQLGLVRDLNLSYCENITNVEQLGLGKKLKLEFLQKYNKRK